MKPLSKSISVLVILLTIISVLNFGRRVCRGRRDCVRTGGALCGRAKTDGVPLKRRYRRDGKRRRVHELETARTEPTDTKFNVYCNGELIAENLDATNYTHMGGNANNVYQIAPVIDGEAGMLSRAWKY